MDKKSNGTKISEYRYTYNAKGLLTTETANVDGISYTMTYDSLGRVLTRVEETLATHTTKTETYTYDAAGNITSFTSSNESGTMRYNSKNRLTSYKGTTIT